MSKPQENEVEKKEDQELNTIPRVYMEIVKIERSINEFQSNRLRGQVTDEQWESLDPSINPMFSWRETRRKLYSRLYVLLDTAQPKKDI